ncbi:MAG: hypothetical protein ACRESO_04955, partial [Gammaproteobacteria bacterium]
LMSEAGGRVETRSSSPVAIVNRPVDNSGSGFPSSYFTGDGHGIYSADTFSMPVAGSVDSITADGFAQSSTAAGLVSDATSISWYVYADANGEPAGNPEDGKSDYLWSFTLSSPFTGVTVNPEDFTLDFATAGAAALNLSAGKYWLVVAPTFNDQCKFSSGIGGCTNEAWYWFESAAGGGSGSIIDPGNLIGAPAGKAATNWELIGPNTQVNKSATGSVELAFELMGTLNCSGSGISPIPGLNLSASSGTVQPNASGAVTVTFNPASLSAGTYSGVLCVQGNDPNTPFAVVPVTENVAAAPPPPPPPPSSSGGGGGGLGMLALVGLLGLAISRKRRD